MSVCLWVCSRVCLLYSFDCVLMAVTVLCAVHDLLCWPQSMTRTVTRASRGCSSAPRTGSRTRQRWHFGCEHGVSVLQAILQRDMWCLKSALPCCLPFRFVALQEGESLSRWLTCLLQPAHVDPQGQQTLEFPGLNGLTSVQLSVLRHKLLPTDEHSFFRFYTSLFVKAKR